MLRRTRRNSSRLRLIALLSAVSMLAVAGYNTALAIGLKYVDAVDAFGSTPNLTPQTAIGAVGMNDDKWGFRADFGSLGPDNQGVFESSGGEASPELTQKITGLAANTSYDVYAVYWSDNGENWTIRVGTTPGNLKLYNFAGASGGTPTPGSTAGTFAGVAAWDTPPFTNGDGTIFTQRPADPLFMLLGKAPAPGTSDGSGNLNVFIDDLPASGTGRRSWLDGVAYVVAGTPIALTATVDRATGALSISNPIATPFQIKSYSVRSASGSLDGADWATIAGPPGTGANSSFDPDPWHLVAPLNPAGERYATQLSEAEDASGGSSGGTLAASGGSLNLGNVWTKTPIEDLVVNLVLADDTPVVITTQYTGTAITPGDLDGVGGVALADFQALLTNLQTNFSSLTLVEAYQRGDMTGDRLINFKDFQAFRAAYDLAHGEGSFEVLLTQIPEPGSLAMVLVMAALLFAYAGRHCRGCLILSAASRLKNSLMAALLALGAMGQAASAVPLLAVDMNDRTVGDPSPTDPANSVPGFSPFILTATGTPTTQTIGAYTVVMGPWDDGTDGNPAGAIDDRDRALPINGGALTYEQIYDDFIFAGTSVGPTGGIDLTINGGALLPNKAYSVSIYSYDGEASATTTRRSATWRDRNNIDEFVLKTNWVDDVPPTTNDTYKFTGVAFTDATGKLSLRGRGDAVEFGQAPPHNNGPPVYINGFEINDYVPGAELTLEVNTVTGAVRVVNQQATTFNVSYYEIRSPSGALNTSGWSSLDDKEAGDPVGTGWDEAPSSNANLLSEVNLQVIKTITTSPGTNSASLGAAFAIGGAHDVRFYYSGPTDTELRLGLVNYVTFPAGDFDRNTMVNAADFNKWKGDFGANNGSDADADDDSDGGDFLAWQRNFGVGVLVAPAGAPVPEPAAGVLLLMAASAARGGRFWRRRRRDGSAPADWRPIMTDRISTVAEASPDHSAWY